jgi:spore maturation protein CgeB
MANALPEKRRKILLSFPFSEKGGWFIPLGEGCADALEELGFEVIRFNPVVDPLPDFVGRKWVERLAVLAGRLLLQSKSSVKQRLPWSEEAIYFRRLLEAARRVKPDVFFAISTYTYPRHVLQRVRREGGIEKTIGWCIEGPTWKRSPAEEAALYDHYFCGYRPPNNPPSVVHLSALAYDPKHYRLLQPHPGKDVDVVFVARPKARRIEFMKAILDFRPLVFGPRWTTEFPEIAPFVGGDQIAGEELNVLYNRAKVVLNISNWDNAKVDCPNLRIVDVPASGSFLLSDYSASAAEMFEPGREVEFFHSPEELREKLAFYLANDAARERIARAGYERVCRLGTYRDKMMTLMAASGYPCNAQPKWDEAGRDARCVA